MNIEVYRFIENNDEVLSKDFLSQYERHQQANVVIKQRLNDDDYYSVSVIEDVEEASSSLRKIPYLKKKFKGIAKGCTYITDGCIRHTPSSIAKSHIDWWLYENAEPEKYFQVIGEEHHEK